MTWLAGPRLGRANPSMPVFYPPNLVPAGGIHANPTVHPSGPTHGNPRPTNYGYRPPPRSSADHAFNPIQPMLYPRTNDLIPPFPAFNSPMADSSTNTSTLPASQIPSGAAGADSYAQFLGPAAPYLYNSPDISSASGSSISSTMSNLHLASRGSSYVTLTDTGSPSIPGTPYASHNVSISSDSSHAHPPTFPRSFDQLKTLGVSPEHEHDEVHKVIIRRVPPGVTPQQLSEHLDKIMPRYVQHKKPRAGEDNKWCVVFSKEEDVNKAVERLKACEFLGKKLTAVRDTESVSRKRIGSSQSVYSASSSSTAQGNAMFMDPFQTRVL
ncbi:hypothetical protein BDR22DRAFT_558564 [Usnea florida]